MYFTCSCMSLQVSGLHVDNHHSLNVFSLDLLWLHWEGNQPCVVPKVTLGHKTQRKISEMIYLLFVPSSHMVKKRHITSGSTIVGNRKRVTSRRFRSLSGLIWLSGSAACDLRWTEPWPLEPTPDEGTRGEWESWLRHTALPLVRGSGLKRGWRGGRGSRGRKTRSWWRQRQYHSWTSAMLSHSWCFISAFPGCLFCWWPY